MSNRRGELNFNRETPGAAAKQCTRFIETTDGEFIIMNKTSCQESTGTLTLSKDMITMTTMEIAKQTGKEHRNVLRDTRKMLTELYGSDALLKFEQPYDAADGNVYDCFALPKNEVLTLVSGYSIPLRAKIIRRWDELENGDASYKLKGNKKEEFELQMLGVKYCADILNCSDSSRLQLVHAVHEYQGVPTAALPAYTENVRVTLSATALLKDNKCSMGARKFNDLMIEKGYLEIKERPSSKGGVKTFKSLTETGLEYGQNDAHPKNPRETQPHYFEDTFMDLFRLIKE